MLAALQTGDSTQRVWTIAAELGIALLAITGLVALLMRKFFQSTREQHAAQLGATAPRTENPSAFMAASMQGVIHQLREQEKELERLHRIEKERAEQTERLSEEVTRNMPAGLLVVNATGIISTSNPAAEQVLGIRGLGFRRYSEALGPSSALTRLVANCLSTGKIFRREEVEHVPPAGDTRHLGVTISPIRRGEGKISGVICLLTDLTELAALQQRMQLKENLAALGELSAGIAHEFKNALATISGYAQMIQSEATAGEATEYAERILKQTRNITHVVTEFLKYARPLEIPDESVELERMVARVVSEVGESMPQVTVRYEGTFGDVEGDEGLLRQALLNLVRNAAEACVLAADRGNVLVRGETGGTEETGFQRVIIQDDGHGIPTAALLKLFHPFFTTKANGTGLGLAVVQKIVVQHGGQVEARNRPEAGAEFIVTLPLSRRMREAVQLKEDRI